MKALPPSPRLHCALPVCALAQGAVALENFFFGNGFFSAVPADGDLVPGFLNLRYGMNRFHARNPFKVVLSGSL